MAMDNHLFLDCQIINDVPHVLAKIDGESLVALVSQFEAAKGYTDPIGGYGPLVCEKYLGPMDKCFRGLNEAVENDERGEVYLLGCECGVNSCWPLVGYIRFTDTQVVWERFSHPFREKRDYSDLGPFKFDLAQYQREVAKISAFIE